MERWGHGGGGCRPVPVLCSSALREERLLLTQTGSSSPCLDLRYPEAPPYPSLASLCAAEGSSPSVGPRADGLGTRWLHRGSGGPRLVREADAPEAPWHW